MVQVLPTRVGMVRTTDAPPVCSVCSPHPRGDGPPGRHRYPSAGPFSPPAWGWSSRFALYARLQKVLPTRVGMVLIGRTILRSCPSSPHPRGDGPYTRAVLVASLVFSPPAWGWSLFAPASDGTILVLPTRVGMVLATGRTTAPGLGSPHPRGDGPLGRNWFTCARSFSPPAWGWSLHAGFLFHIGRVLPTRVGMVPRHRLLESSRSGSPHPRGDGPCCRKHAGGQWRFSPPAWGWSAGSSGPGPRPGVLPTRVGMVLTYQHPPFPF